MNTLHARHCTAGATALSTTEIESHLAMLHGWALVDGTICKTYTFKNYHQTIAFVNASAWVSHQQDHHPDMSVHYNRCVVSYSTHDAGGITLNDFICAARLDQLFAA